MRTRDPWAECHGNAPYPLLPDCPEKYRCLNHTLQASFRTGKFTDCSFLVSHAGGRPERFPAHRLILALRSEVFAVMLFGTMKEAYTPTEVVITDVPPEAFRNLLLFVYTDHCEITCETGTFATGARAVLCRDSACLCLSLSRRSACGGGGGVAPRCEVFWGRKYPRWSGRFG